MVVDSVFEQIVWYYDFFLLGGRLRVSLIFDFGSNFGLLELRSEILVFDGIPRLLKSSV